MTSRALGGRDGKSRNEDCGQAAWEAKKIGIFGRPEHIAKPNRILSVRIGFNGSERVKVVVQDSGIGIPPENLTRIVQDGFTTRLGGHGFGAHSGALAVKELGGTLYGASDGLVRRRPSSSNCLSRPLEKPRITTSLLGE